MSDDGKVLNTIGARNCAKSERAECDFYATHPLAISNLLQYGGGVQLNHNILEPCAGNGNLVIELRNNGYNVEARDIVQREFALDKVEDFFGCNDVFDGDIITNPPFNSTLEFIHHALDICRYNVWVLLPLRYLEGKQRYRELYKCELLRSVYVFYSRVPMYRNGQQVSGNALSFAWYCFNHSKGIPTLHFIPGA